MSTNTILFMRGTTHVAMILLIRVMIFKYLSVKWLLSCTPISSGCNGRDTDESLSHYEPIPLQTQPYNSQPAALFALARSSTGEPGR